MQPGEISSTNKNRQPDPPSLILPTTLLNTGGLQDYSKHCIVCFSVLTAILPSKARGESKGKRERERSGWY
jgi:hypothetical protein